MYKYIKLIAPAVVEPGTAELRRHLSNFCGFGCLLQGKHIKQSEVIKLSLAECLLAGRVLRTQNNGSWQTKSCQEGAAAPDA